VYLQITPTLIVIDGATSLYAEALREIGLRLGAAWLLVCTNDGTLTLESAPRLVVPPLDEAAAMRVLQLEARAKMLRTPEALPEIYAAVGGYPRALKLAVGMGVMGMSQAFKVSVAVYRGFWDTLNQADRLAWLVAVLWHNPLPDGSASDLAQGRARLALLFDSDTQELIPMARTFGMHVLSQSQQGELVHAAFEHVLDTLMDNDAEALDIAQLLNMAHFTGLPTDFMLNMAYTIAALVEATGVWRAWAEYLELLYDLSGASKNGPEAETEPQDVIWVATRLGVAFRWLADWDKASHFLGQAIQMGGETGHFALQAEAMLELALLFQVRGQFEEAAQLLARADHYFWRVEKLRHPRVWAACIQGALDSDHWALALRYLHEVMPDYRDIAATPPQILTLAAQIAARQGQYDDAEMYAISAWKALAQDKPRRGRLAMLLGEIYQKRDRLAEAFAYITLAINLAAEIGDMLGAARARLNLALLYVGQGRLKTALKHLRDLPTQFEALKDARALTITLENLAYIQRSLEDN
jgi:tetratricopeptide (TPR) repeat protein